MKKNLFTKFLALFLSGAMLVSVGCKDYDDDIDGINKRLDELITGKIASMEDQMAALQTTVTNLQNADNLLSQRIEALKTDVTANAGEITKLQTAQTALRSDITKIQNDLTGYVKQTTLDNTLGLYTKTADLGKTYASLQSLGVFTSQKAIQDAIDAAKEAAISAAGAACEGAFNASFSGQLTAALTGDGQIAKALEKYNADITAALTKSITEEGGEINGKIAGMISTAVGTLQAQIDTLKKQIDALASQIQSLVYIPEFDNGETDMTVYSAGSTEVGNLVTLKFRVAPAAAAASMQSLFSAGKVELVAETVKTRAAADPALTITGISTEGMAEGVFAVSANVANYPASDKLAVALAIKSNIYAEEGQKDIDNDVVSNYGVVAKAAQPGSVSFALVDGDNKAVAGPKAYTMPWNEPAAVSKATLLEGYDLKASLDGTTYESLDVIAKRLGATFGSKITYTAVADGTVDAALKFTNKDIAWPGKLATIEFAKALTSAEKGKTVSVKHNIKFDINADKNVEILKDFVTSYTVTNQIGATLNFTDQSKPWTYSFVSANGNTSVKNPAFTTNEIAVTGNLSGVSLKKILTDGVADIQIVSSDPADNSAALTISPVADEIAKIVTMKLTDYTWGNTYTISAKYTLDNTDYMLNGKIAMGAAPAKVVYNYAAEDKAYGTFTKTGDWTSVFGQVPAGFFTDKDQFVTAIFDGGKTATVATVRNDKKTSAEKTPINNSNGTEMVVNNMTLKGTVNKLDVNAIGNRFIQTAKWMTWYGQEIEVSMTFDITLAAPSLVENPDRLANGVHTASGAIAGDVWSIANVNVADFYSLSLANAGISIEYAVESKNANGKIYPILSGTILAWDAASTTEKEVQVSAQMMLDGRITVGEKSLFKVKVEDPIKTFAAPATPQAVAYVSNKDLTFTLTKGISLVDIAGKPWIKADGTFEKSGTNNAFAIFHMETADANTAGIEFGAPTTANGTFSGEMTITNGVLTINSNQASLAQDVIVTIPAKITYWLGGTKSIDVTVKVTK